MARSNVVQFPTAQKIEHYQSTEQAADFLNVSQPYLDELLSKGEIPFRRVGAESLVVVKIKDVIGYKKQEDQSRAIDNGFKTLLNTSLSSDLSKLYENLVFLQLRRHHREVYYYKEVQEVDFYVPGTQARLVNVSVNIEGTKTLDREINGLLEAMKYLQLDRAELVTQHRHEQIEIEGQRIDIVPLWRWLLSENG